MGTEYLESILIWVQAHPLAAGFAIFAAAVAESLFIFGLLVPGALFMFIAGALVGAGALPLMPVMIIAVAGAIVGDSASFALGYAYRGNLHQMRLLQRAPRLLARGEDFLRRHGGKSIILGRFIGPLRPLLPTITGAAGMPPLRFLAIDIIAAIGWAPCYILPGVLFGASLDLAAQVAGRLALLLLLVAAAVWLLVWASRWLLVFGAAWSREYAERLLSWSRRHRRLGLLGLALADPRQPETPVLALVATLLLLLTWCAYSLVWGWGTPSFPQASDALVYHLAQSLHTPLSDFVALVIAQLGAPAIYLPLAAAIGMALFILTGKRAAMHWLAAISFAVILVLGLRWLMTIPTPKAYFDGVSPASGFAGGHILISGVIYGFLAVILATPQRPNWRQYYYSGFIALVVLIASARLYLGLDWLSDVIIGLGIAFLWITLLTLGYRRQRPRKVRPRPLFAMLVAALAAAVVWQLLQQSGQQIAVQTPESQQIQRVAQWYTQDYNVLPKHVNDMAGRQREPLNLQVNGQLEAIRADLIAAGWHPPVTASLARSLLWLAPDKPISQLPVLPRSHDGTNADLTLIHADSFANPDQQWILRLWHSNFINGQNQSPLWLGQITQQRVRNRFGLLRLPNDQAEYSDALYALGRYLPAERIKIIRFPQISGAQATQPVKILLWDNTQPVSR